jgi:hypothetical protein
MPNEILLETFEYISSCDLVYGFFDLNQRFNSILNQIELDLDLSHVQYRTFQYACQTILSKFTRQILSIKLSNKQTIDGIDYYLKQPTRSRQDYVQHLILIEPTIEQLMQLIAYFPALLNLTVKTSDFLNIPIEYLPSTLRVCRLSNCQLIPHEFDKNNTSIYSIEELHVKMSDTADLFHLLDSMNHLKRLTCHLSESLPTNPTNINCQQYLIELTYLKLAICAVSFRYIEQLLDRCPNLVSFIYTYTTGSNPSYDHEHINHERWHDLLTNKCSKLTTLDLHISLNIDSQRNMIHIADVFQNLGFCRRHAIRIIYEITTYKHILCTLPSSETYSNKTNNHRHLSTMAMSSNYSRIRHLDLILNETMLNQQQHTLRCPLVHSFYLGLYQTMTPIEQQSRLLLNQSLSFVYLKHFELYGTCLTDGFVALLLSHMTSLNSLTLPFNHLVSCQINATIRTNMKRIQKLQLALIETISIECIRNSLIPIFPNLHSIIFATDNRIETIDAIVFALIGNIDRFQYLMFLEIFALDHDWTTSMFIRLEKLIRYKFNHRILHVWL